MIPRLAEHLICQRLRQFPAVGVVGPRQSGKTTLARSLSSRYFDLEQETDRVRLDLSWDEVTSSDELIVLDEAQAWPAVFPRLRGVIDARRQVKGRFLVLGSVAPSLMKEISESLAGRLAPVELSPLSAAELSPEYHDALWRCGGFPDGGVLDADSGAYPVWQRAYLSQMAARDLPQWGLTARAEQTERLLRLTAALNGGQINASQLGQGMNLSYHTVQSWLDHLEGAFLIRRLRPFFANNFPKRLIKTPKLYWRDSGLLHALLGWQPGADIFAQRWAGESWEGWVIEQILSVRQAAGEDCDAFYFRTSDGLECDLLLESGGQREVIEIKMSSGPALEDFRKLAKIAQLTGATRQVLICRIPDSGVVMNGEQWLTNPAAYLRPFCRPQMNAAGPRRPEISVPLLYQRLSEAAGALKERRILSDEQLMRRAQWLKDDLAALEMDGFRILPASWIEPPGSGVRIPLVEYTFGPTDHDINLAGPSDKLKDLRMMEGTGLNREELLYFSRVSEAGHILIPHLWLGRKALRERVRDSRQHLNTLNEVWWLTRWRGLDADSVEMEHQQRRDAENAAKVTPSTVDWRFTLLAGAITINLEVKNRAGTIGSAPLEKGVYLFGDEPDKCFQSSGEDEINVLAITGYHGGWISQTEESKLVQAWLEGLSRPVVDAVIVSVVRSASAQSYTRIYFPTSRSLAKKDLILKTVLHEMDAEDTSRVGVSVFPMSLEQRLREIGWKTD